MGGNDLDFTPLKTYAMLLRSVVLIRRIGRVLFRLLFILFVAGIVWAIVTTSSTANRSSEEQIPQTTSQPTVKTETMPDGETTTYSYSCSGSECPIQLTLLVLLIPFVLFPVQFAFVSILTSLCIMIAGSIPWSKFAQRNQFRLETDMKSAIALMKIPSFKGKLLAMKLFPIVGVYNAMQFAIFTRIYKEGGVLRWRERKMDTIMRLDLQVSLPHIVINARANEKVRASNLTERFDSSMKFQFEGVYGVHYDVYAATADQVTALQVFTPDVLEVLYTKLPTTDIEIQGNAMWLVQRYVVLDDVAASKLFDAASDLYGELSKQIRTVH